MALIAGLEGRLLTLFSLCLGAIAPKSTSKSITSEGCFISCGLGFFVGEQWRTVRRIIFFNEG